jgi:hypothetical protein
MLPLSSSCSSCPRRWRRTSHLRNCRGENSRWYCVSHSMWPWLEMWGFTDKHYDNTQNTVWCHKSGVCCCVTLLPLSLQIQVF